MYKLIVFVVFVAGALNYTTATDYCDKKLCEGFPLPHIGCNNNGSFASQCPKDASIVPMTDELKTIILNNFNEYREFVASNETYGFYSAADMTQMQWDDELSSLAELNVKQCVEKLDNCHNTEKYRFSGQNIGTSTITDPKEAFEEQIIIWYYEHEVCDEYVIDEYRKSKQNPRYHCEYFTLMLNHKSDRVGCAASKYTRLNTSGQNDTVTLIACNFSYTNVEEEPVYVKGEPCSKCKTGCSQEYESLCTKEEVIEYVPDHMLKAQQG